MSKIDQYRKEIEYCTYCPKMCRFSCPVAQAEKKETLTPTGKSTILHLLRMGALEWSEEVVEPLYYCTGCLISRTFCDHGIEVFPPFVAAREEIIQRGVAPEKIMKQDEVVSEWGTPYGRDLSRELDGYVPTRFIRRDAEVTFFVGCITTVFFDKHIRDTLNLLEAAGADVGVYVDRQICCGYPSYCLGHRESFEKIAHTVGENLKDAGAIVTICPTCAHALRDLYPRLAGVNLNGPVLHLAQFLHPYYKSGKLGFEKKAGRLLYHDPCHLGRYAGAYDEPRDLLRAAAKELVEFPWNREESGCCGGGGGLIVYDSAAALRIGRERARFANEVGPDHVVSACPTCEKMFQRTWERRKVIDLVRVLNDSLSR